MAVFFTGVPLVCPVEGATRRLDLICRSVLVGDLDHRDGLAATRATEAWLRAVSDRLAMAVDELGETLEAKERELEGLRRELARRDVRLA